MKLPSRPKANKTSKSASKIIKLSGKHQAEIIGLTHDGLGVAKIDGKTVFVAQAVPGDLVKIKITEDLPKLARGRLLEIIESSADRTEPFCQYFGKCGGCSLQHLSAAAQIQWKQANLLDQLQKVLNCKKLQVLPAVQAAELGYRRRAKLVLTKDKQDKTARFGFKAHNSDEVIDIESCPVLTPALNAKLKTARFDLLPLASRQVKQVLLVEDGHNQAWLSTDITDFGNQYPSNPTLASEENQLPTYQFADLSLQFVPTGFIQVNSEINQQLIEQALTALELKPTDKVLDLFCGIGNFTLPIAKLSAKAVGVEVNQQAVAIAQQNARLNQLANLEFFQADLFIDDLNEQEILFAGEEGEDIAKKTTSSNQAWLQQEFDKIVLDPGRLGAKQICEQIARFKAQKIVYISCQSATLIRDLAILEAQNYRIKTVQVFDMFPHTNHFETLVLLEKFKAAGQKP